MRHSLKDAGMLSHLHFVAVAPNRGNWLQIKVAAASRGCDGAVIVGLADTAVTESFTRIKHEASRPGLQKGARCTVPPARVGTSSGIRLPWNAEGFLVFTYSFPGKRG